MGRCVALRNRRGRRRQKPPSHLSPESGTGWPLDLLREPLEPHFPHLSNGRIKTFYG